MLVRRAYETEFVAETETVLYGPFPLARSHVMQIRIVALVAFRESVSGVHFHERSLVTLREVFPVVASVACLVPHVMRCDEDFVASGLFFPVFYGCTLHKRGIEVIVQGHVVAVLQTVRLISDECQELSLIVVLVRHPYILLVVSAAESLESVGMVADHPFEARIVFQSVYVRPHGVRSDADEVKLFLCRFESITHVSVTVCDVTVVVQVSPEQFQPCRGRHDLFRFFRAVHACLEKAAGSCQSHEGPA